MQIEVVRWFLFGVGIVSLVLGIIGIFIPLLPTTPFVLLAGWCFMKSSERFHLWMMRHKQFGPIIRDWQERGAIALSAKIFAISMLAVSFVVVWLRVELEPLKYGVSLFLVFLAGFIFSRPSN